MPGLIGIWRQRNDFLVVEGAGGLYVPLVDNDFLVLDLARWLGLPVLVVARAGLGTINHTVMTVKTLQQAGLPVVGIIINQYPEKPNLAALTNPGIIEAISGRAVLAKVPVIPDLTSTEGKAALIQALAAVFETPAWREFYGRSSPRTPQDSPWGERTVKKGGEAELCE